MVLIASQKAVHDNLQREISLRGDKVSMLTLKVPVTAIDALQHFETG